MAAAFDFVEGSVHEFDLPDLDKAFQRMEAASVMIRELQDLRSPHRGATPPTDATAIAKHLVAAAVAQTRLRHNACTSVLDNLRYCKANGLTYDPLRSYAKGDTTPGPDSRKKTSPGSTKRARTALKEAGNLRDAVEVFNNTCIEQGKKPLGKRSIRLLRDLAGDGPDGIHASKRVRQPMVSKVNKKDRLAMAKVIKKCKTARDKDIKFCMAKDVIYGDEWMVEIGSGDMETRYEWLASNELPTPISVVKFPSKLMLHAWVGWNFKSKLVWCNEFGTLKGEAAWSKLFWKELEKDGGGCLDEFHDDDEACMACEACLAAREKCGCHSFNEIIESLEPGVKDSRGRRIKGASDHKPDVRVWMDGAGCHWTNESIDCLEELGLERSERSEMKQGIGDILYSPTHRLKRTPGSTADGTVMDSGVIRHFKMKLRSRLSKENGGRRQVLNKERMMEICEEVWDAIPIEDLRCYFQKLPKTWDEIHKQKGKWVGWSAGSNVRHGVS